jgi:hypothetical protein|tara:strand:- start:1802 stop:2137 length:336 start_codon:yes stop_codon:yes gene_type:complete
MDYYDPREIGIDDLVKRIRIGYATKDFLNTSVGHAILNKALNDYVKGLNLLEDIGLNGFNGSSEEELTEYRKIISDLSTPLKALKWFDSVIQEGENADKIEKYKSSGQLEP